MAGTLAIVTVVPLLAAAVRLEGSATCPAPGRVEAKLALLLPEAPGPQHVARVDDVRGALVLALETEEGVLLARKELPRQGTCTELAQVAAVVIAAWEARFREGTLALPDAPSSAAHRPAPPAPAPADTPEPVAPAVSAPAPSELPPAVPPAAHAPPAPPPASTPEEPSPEPPPSTSPLRIRGELGAVAGFSARWAFGALARGSIGGAHASVVALALIETPRVLTLGEGGVRWSRPLVGAGARWRLHDDGPRLELEGGAAVAWLRLRGTGFSQNATASAIDTAAWAGATVSWHMGSWRPFVGALGLAWLQDQQARVRITTTSAPEESVSRGLPRVQALGVVGLSFPSG